MEDILFEAVETVGEQPKRAAVAVGRFQPPTRGHYKMIDAMRAFIREQADLKLDISPIVVIIAGAKTGEDRVKNPLSADQRASFMKASGQANGVKILVAGSAFAAFEEVRKAGYEPIALAAGTDRASNYMKMLDKYFTKADGGAIKHYEIPGLERDPDADNSDGDDAYDMIIRMINDGDRVDDAQISASLARYAAKQGEMKAFAYISGIPKKMVLAKMIAGKITSSSEES
jgi:hypothetical protein